MKKYLALILALVLALSLCACGEDEVVPTNPDTTPEATQPNVTDPAPTDPDPTVQETEPHIHEYTVEEIAPTCTEDGSVTHSCVRGDVQKTVIPANGHVFGAWIVTEKPSMTTTGKHKQICTVCEYEVFEDMPVNTLEQEVEAFLKDLLFCMPEFKSVDSLGGGSVFNWAFWHIPQVSWNMDENYLITIVFSIDDLDDFSQKYLGKIFDYYYLEEPNKDFMKFDREKREITIFTGGAGGGGYEYSIDSLTEKDDGTYALRYKGVDPYVENPDDPSNWVFGNMEFKVVDGHLQILSHTMENDR